MRAGRIAAAALACIAVALASSADAAPPAKGCDRANFRLIVDVGHTADAPGAMSARGIGEFTFNERLANEVVKKLQDAGFAKTVLMVSTGPSKKSMYARIARANAMLANLLLSVHHDAVPDSFREKWEFEGKELFYSDRFSGHSLFISDGNRDRKNSLRFGHLLGEQLKSRGLPYTPHYTESFMGKFRRYLVDAFAGVYRYDTLFLLKKSRVPAVLLEAGSIVNRADELVLASPERQTLIAAAVTDAVAAYCEGPSRDNAAPLVARAQPQQNKRGRKVRSVEAQPPAPGAAP